MKPYSRIYILVLIFASTGLFGQTADEMSALTEFVPAETLAELEASNPDRLAKLAVLNRRGYEVAPAGEKNISDLPDALTVAPNYQELPSVSLNLAESGELNLMGYGFNVYPDQYSYYRIGDSGMVLTIYPANLTFERAQIETE